MKFKDYFIRSTPERRAGVFELKLMLDEAHRLRESGQLRPYANKVADITIAHHMLHPQLDESNQEVMLIAYRYRSLFRSRPLFHSEKAIKQNLNHLDRAIARIGGQLSTLEKQLRLALFVELIGKPGPFI